jgi:Fe2+ or Zn2+ uptake regulation protein
MAQQSVKLCFALNQLMDLLMLVQALDDTTRLELLKILSRRPKTVNEVSQELKKIGKHVKYRQTVYRALEKLLDVGLLDKHYEKGRGLVYRLRYRKIYLDLKKMEAEMANSIKDEGVAKA